MSFWSVEMHKGCTAKWNDVAGNGETVEDKGGLYSFTASREAFLGIKSSMKGSKPGYVSRSFWRRPRCTEDLTFDRLLGGILAVKG